MGSGGLASSVVFSVVWWERVSCCESGATWCSVTSVASVGSGNMVVDANLCLDSN